jgi:pre-mRNA-splicing factor ATP-dependent RNA helicase DHX38/PRP16
MTILVEGILAVNEARTEGPRGLGDFRRRLNREREGDHDSRHGHGRNGHRAWDVTPRSQGRSTASEPGSSVRVPDVPWDSTPRNARSEESSRWGQTSNRLWDAPTPRAVRDGSPEDGDALRLDMREWEEEQVRLDRDWYTGAEDGAFAGNEEHNPLAQYEDLNIVKQAEMAAKQTVWHIFSVYTTVLYLRRKKFPRSEHRR